MHEHVDSQEQTSQVRVCTNMTNNPNLLTDRELEDVTAVFRCLLVLYNFAKISFRANFTICHSFLLV